jgi:phage protein D
MELATLSRGYGNFYAPAFAIRVGTADLMRDRRVAVSQVEIDLALGAASRFSFTVTDAFNFKSRAFEAAGGADAIELLNFGTVLDIAWATGTRSRCPR